VCLEEPARARRRVPSVARRGSDLTPTGDRRRCRA